MPTGNTLPKTVSSRPPRRTLTPASTPIAKPVVTTEPAAASKRSSTLRGDLRSIMADGAAFSVMVGVGETYLPAFVLAAGMGEVAAALVATMPMLAGSLLQLVSPYCVKWLGSHRRWVVLCALCQAFSFVPLLIAVLWGNIPTALVFFIAAIYWGAGLGAGPAWNTWVETLVPIQVRARYFAWRTRMTQAGTLAGFLIGGIALQLGAAAGQRLLTFALLFLIAAVCRFVSACFLAIQSEPQPTAEDHRHVSPREFFARLKGGADGRLLLYLLAVQTSVQIAGPFFTPYMLGHLKLSYAEYAMLVASAFLAKIVALPAIGKMASRYGARKLLWFGGIGIIPLSGMWLISNSYPYLLALQVVGGVAWAAYELAMFLLFFETIKPQERTSMLTTFNCANSAATAIGSLLGWAMLVTWGRHPHAYLALFAASSIARLGTLVLLGRIRATPAGPKPLGMRTLALRADDGSIDRPILGSDAD
jgi:MFS family permease